MSSEDDNPKASSSDESLSSSSTTESLSSSDLSNSTTELANNQNSTEGNSSHTIKLKWEEMVQISHSRFIFISFAGENRELAKKIANYAACSFSPTLLLGEDVFLDIFNVVAGEGFYFIYERAYTYCSSIILLDEHFLSKEAPLKELLAFEDVNMPRVFVFLQPREALLAKWHDIHSSLSNLNDIPPNSLASYQLAIKDQLFSLLSNKENDSCISPRILQLEYPSGISLAENGLPDSEDVENIISLITKSCISQLAQNIRLLLEEKASELKQIESLSLDSNKASAWIAMRKKLNRLGCCSKVLSVSSEAEEIIATDNLNEAYQKYQKLITLMEECRQKFDFLGEKANIMLYILDHTNNPTEEIRKQFQDMCNELSTKKIRRN